MSVLRYSVDLTWSRVAQTVAHRSLCDRAQVGAAIIDPAGRVIATGYNGPPGGFHHQNQTCSAWCPRANPPDLDDAEVRISPEGVFRAVADPDAFDGKTWVEVPQPAGDYSDCPSLHAEANALLASERSQRLGGSMFVSGDVCFGCAKLIAGSGLARVHVFEDGDRAYRNSEQSYRFLQACGIEVVRKEYS